MMQSAGNNEARLITLDAMRGFAVMGILAMNIVAFAMPEWAYITPLAYGGDTQSDRIAWLISFILIDGKMRGLFSLLFGASLMLIIERSQAKGESAARVHYSRMFWLALFGLVHFFFIWMGDILFLYASVGCIAFLFRAWEPERLLKWALIIFAISLAIWGLQFGGLQVMQMFATAPGASPDLVRQYREIMASPDFGFDTARQLALHRGDYVGIVGDKLADWTAPLGVVVQSIGETLPLMMIGMAVKKNGFITGEWAQSDYAHWAAKMVIPGLVLSAFVGGAVVFAGYDQIAALSALFAWGAIPRLMMTIGYAALLIMLIEWMAGSGLIARVAATGQAAFTNYLGTSIIMTTIFYGYGLGLFGYASRVELWLFVIGAWVIMLFWSKAWLQKYRYGPLEWLWRSLARMKLQPLRR
jgi:uncharacterized protein